MIAFLEERQRNAVVYFLQRGNGDIKIGYTTAPRRRFLALAREHGPLKVLGQMSGHRPLEWRLHCRFHQLRVGKTEWFRPEAELLSFIDSLGAAA